MHSIITRFTRKASVLIQAIVLAIFASIAEAPGQGAGGTESPRPIRPNRTVPKVAAPKASLEFSASPTPQDIFLARVFEEPLVPVGGEPASSENAALAAALLAYSKRSSADDFSSLTGFLAAYPDSKWAASLLTNLGIEYYNTGRYSKTLEVWQRAWELSKDATEPKAKAVANRAVGELAYMYARLGRTAELAALFPSVEGRSFTGSATERISGAKQGFWNMQHRPEIAFRCGPLALDRIRAAQNPLNAGHPLIFNSKSSPNGFSLPQVVQLSRELGMNYQMVFREKGTAFTYPAVVHWKAGHYAALIRQDKGRYLVQDPTFGNDLWITDAALDEEASGYFLLPPGPLPTGWRTVEEAEGGTIWGRGMTSGGPPGEPPPPPPPCPTCCPNGMAVADAHLLLVGVVIRDTPVGYLPPVGPPVQCDVTYHQREANQPATFTYSNLGPKWTFGWLAYIKDDPSNPNADAQYFLEGGGIRIFTGYEPNSQSYASQMRLHTKLIRTTGSSYEMQYPDGSRKIFSQSDGATGTSRKVFLTQNIDPAGNVIELIYDASLRVVAISDAIGQVTTLSYEDAADIYRITKVTDPFGRFAKFDYDGSGRLFKITDTLGLTSQFAYDTGDFITGMTTPYGTTNFSKGEIGTTRWLETTDPNGDTSRVEFNQAVHPGLPTSDPPGAVPVGMNTTNSYFEYRNTYYWDKNAFAHGRNDYTKAKIYHWLHGPNLNQASGILESVKMPLDNRVWYDYAGQWAAHVEGATDRPAHVGRVLDDGRTQLYTYEYNSLGSVTKTVDPIGRTFSNIYAANDVDLLEVRQARAGANELLSSTTYNAQHRPLSMTDAAGQTTTYTYNARGQRLTSTNANGETTTWIYDADGYLMAIDGPLPGASDQKTFTYDAYGRLRTETDVDGYTLTYDYDAMDRLTRTTFPDGTFKQNTYERLDRSVSRDRLGRETHYTYNSIRQLVQVEDPLNRMVKYVWCKCGSMANLVDPLGRVTKWHHDIQSRLTSKTYADGSQVIYEYEKTTSRLKSKWDEKGQLTTYDYDLDNNLKLTSYPNAAIPTPAVAFTYDPDYNRVATMQDGTGTTAYAYHPIAATPALGAGRLASVDGPLPNDTISYEYDALSRVVSRSINGVSATTTFDALGRPTGIANALGGFGYTYDGASARVSSLTYPNGQSSAYTYFDNLGDRRLQRISHVNGATPISQFEYTYNAEGNITAWSQQADANPTKSYAFGYDAADQLLSAVLTQGATPLKTYGYAYDKAANRTAETMDGVTRQFSYNPLNELTTTSTGPATAATYEWDAANRLTAIVQGTNRSEFSYDGMDRRVRIVEKQNGSTISDKRFVWCEMEICEERDGTGAAVTKHFYPQGVINSTTKLFYSRDHLDSVRELSDEVGQVRARYEFDPYGRRNKMLGDLDADFAFTGHYYLSASDLNLALYRAYDADLARWLSRDPIDELGGVNLYVYVGNDPIGRVDPFGLRKVCFAQKVVQACGTVLIWICLDIAPLPPLPPVPPPPVITGQKL